MIKPVIVLSVCIISLFINDRSLSQQPPPPPPMPPTSAVETAMVNVGGINTLYHLNGDAERLPGAPVVIFMNGSLASLEAWSGILDRLDAKIPRLAYDRPGAGKSTPVEGKLTPERANVHLAALLKQLNIKPPFVLVSWSWGGPLALDFAQRNPGTVVGNVFLDPTLIGVDRGAHRERLIRLGASAEDVDASDARAEKESREMLTKLPPGFRSELEGLGEVADTFNPPYPRVPTSILFAEKYVPGFTRGSLPSAVDEAKFYQDERAFAKRTLEARIKGVPHAILKSLPDSTHQVPQEAPEAVVEELRRILSLVVPNSPAGRSPN